MTDTKLFLVEHTIKDAEGWANFFAGFMEMLKPDDTTIDKVMANPMWGGHECLLTLQGSEGKFAVCLWQVRSDMSMEDFQTFIDGFSPHSTNASYEVEASFGAKSLNFRGYVRDCLNMARGKESPGYLDADTLWFVHHHVSDNAEWDAKITSGMIEGVNNSSAPSDTAAFFEKGYGSALTLFLKEKDGKKDAICLWGGPKDNLQADYQAVVDRFTQGCATNVPHRINSAISANAMYLAQDLWAQDLFVWGKNEAAKQSKEAPTNATMVATDPISQ